MGVTEGSIPSSATTEYDYRSIPASLSYRCMPAAVSAVVSADRPQRLRKWAKPEDRTQLL
ncbi:MAG TPA: hypothetical protein VK017_04725 [Sphingobacterium sp.]|nr:hypothetical protein [Sphingobacterium sp.]